MIKRTTKYLLALGLTAGLTQSVFAWPDTGWTGLANDGLWTSPGNWSGGVVPGGAASGDTNGAIQIDAANGWSVVTIPSNTVINCDASFATIFGPEWGATLNIRGTLNCSWYMAPVGNTSVINVYTNGAYHGEGIGLGNNWWWWGGAGVTLNLYGNAQVGINYLFWGGYINLNDQSILSITNGLDQRTQDSVTDAARGINLKGGKLLLPAGFTSTVTDWINRGVLSVYGVPNDAAEIVIDEADTNWPGRTVVYTTATNANPILAIHLSLVRTNLHLGGMEQAQVLADYASATGVNITTTPGMNITYKSTATNVVTISSSGFVRAIGSGTSTLWAFQGNLSNSVSVTVSTYTNTAALRHRYSFSETAGSSTVADSVGGSIWDGTLLGGAAVTGSGHLTLDQLAASHVQLPAGIITNLDAVSVETWCSFGSISNWAVLFTFGDTTGTVGINYLSFQPHTGANTVQTGIKNATLEQNPWFTPVLDNSTNVHIVAVYHPEAGYCSIYTNGVLAAINPNIQVSIPEVTATGDPYNYIGRSLWSADPYLDLDMDEFRIYSGPLTPGQIAADHALGPNQLIGSNLNVSLSARLSGNNIILTWPSNSALVDVKTSSTLGAGAVWVQATGTLAINGGNYEMTVPISGSAAFFRLQK